VCVVGNDGTASTDISMMPKMPRLESVQGAVNRYGQILTVVGARPQFVKAGVVSQALRRAGVCEILVHTGQHYDPAMSEVFFQELSIPPPAHHLGVGSGSHGAQTGKMLESLERVILDECPARVLVYGDTNSTIAGALAAAKLNVPVDHVEAGLRSFNRRMPEEVNRVMTDHLSSRLYAPTIAAVENLRREGLVGQGVVHVGDVMCDATLAAASIARRESRILTELSLSPKGYVLATVHRAENTDDVARLAAILHALGMVARKLPVVLPLHPRTRAAIARAGLIRDFGKSLKIIEPIGYIDMTRLESDAALIATDSGGVQKEAFLHGVPCITLRTETEWGELVESGWNQLCDPLDPALAQTILGRVGTVGTAVTPYGDGHAADRIAADLRHMLACGVTAAG
jgi:UDP-GlcNAc3NAcA epimerase